MHVALLYIKGMREHTRDLTDGLLQTSNLLYHYTYRYLIPMVLTYFQGDITTEIELSV